tara:strand:+ start:760 stop:1761 length:1002 start_codon:yes stop_codon:yes gene_type:complete
MSNLNIFNNKSLQYLLEEQCHLDSIPVDQYDQLLDYLKLSRAGFINYWDNIFNSNYMLSNSTIKLDWLLSICFPLISYCRRKLEKDPSPIILGISGLPGCGKSTLGKVLEELSMNSDLSLNVISLDDFYYPAKELDKAMYGNPWNVPRGLPGAHSLSDMQSTLDRFVNTGELIAPIFDKSLRNGYGDREGILESQPKVLVIEGWFLGCTPVTDNKTVCDLVNDDIQLNLSNNEREYRLIIQDNLCNYLPIWKMISKLWHIRAEEFQFTSIWKQQQENNMLIDKGSSLSGSELESFVRMISSAIPQKSLQEINADITININLNRRVTSLFTNNK